MDRVLHAERLAAPEEADLAALPPGSIFAIGAEFFLRTGRGALRWTFGGYEAATGISGAVRVRVLTPPSTRGALAAGYRPLLHPSVQDQFSAR
jgi:hypothetical protein